MPASVLIVAVPAQFVEVCTVSVHLEQTRLTHCSTVLAIGSRCTKAE